MSFVHYVRYWKRHCKPGWFPATASLSEQRRRLQWLLQKRFYKLWLGVKDDVTLSMRLIEQAVALLAYILCKIIIKKKKKNPVLDLGQYHLVGNSQMGVSRICTSPLPFQGSGSPSYFANNSSPHPTACSHFLLRTCLWLSTAHHLSGCASHFSVANWRPSYKLDTISNVMKEKSFYGPILFLLFLACGNTSNRIALKFSPPASWALPGGAGRILLPAPLNLQQSLGCASATLSAFPPTLLTSQLPIKAIPPPYLLLV